MSVGRGLRALIRSNDRRFVKLLCDQANLTVESLALLEQFGREPRPHEEVLQEIKHLERAGDEVRRMLIDELVRTFATPFDREDLFALSRSIDDKLDAADETAVELSMYQIDPPEALCNMASLLGDGARHIRSAVAQLLDHPSVAVEHAVRAKRTENRMDELYRGAVSRLFDSELTRRTRPTALTGLQTTFR